MLRGKDSIGYIIEKIQDERRLKPYVSTKRSLLNNIESDLNRVFKDLGDKKKIKGRFGSRLPYGGTMIHSDFYLPMKSLKVSHKIIPDAQVVLYGIDLSKYDTSDVGFMFGNDLGNKIGESNTSIMFNSEDLYPGWNSLTTLDEREEFLNKRFTSRRYNIDFIKASYPTLCDFFIDGFVPKGMLDDKTLNVKLGSMKDVPSGSSFFTGAFAKGFLERVQDWIKESYSKNLDGLEIVDESFKFMEDRKYLPIMAGLFDEERFEKMLDSWRAVLKSVNGYSEKDYIYFVKLSSAKVLYKNIKSVENAINTCIPGVYIKGKGFGSGEVFNPFDRVKMLYKEVPGLTYRMNVNYDDYWV